MSRNAYSIPALRALMLAAALACTVAPPAAMAWPFGSEQVEGNGNVTRQARQVGRFTGISLQLPGRLEVRSNGPEGVTVETDDNLQALVETTVENGMLRIRPARRGADLRPRNLKIVVNARGIDHLALGSSGTIDADALRAPGLNITLGGSGKIHVRSVEGDKLAVAVGGSGDLRVGGGAVRDVSVSIGGSGDVDLGRVAADQARISVAGSGDVTVWAKQDLRISVAGSGDVNYYGDPQLRRSVAGSGEARRLGGAPN